MDISADDVRHLEQLAALHLSDADRERMRGHLQRILGYMQQLAVIDIEGIEPTTHGHVSGGVVRPDTVRPSLPEEVVLQNAPEARGPFYRVPRFVGETETEAGDA